MHSDAAGLRAHLVDEREARRIQQIVRALQSRTDGVEGLGICRCHTRGRRGAEVACWHLDRLLEIAETASPQQKQVVFGQVSWLCEGAGRRRLRQAIGDWLRSVRANADERRVHRDAQVLLDLLDWLPPDFYGHRIHLLLLAGGAAQSCWSVEDCVANLAALAGFESRRGLDRFREQVDQSLMRVLQLEHAAVSRPSCMPSPALGQVGDEWTEGAMVAALGGEAKPEVGVIARVEQEGWDAITREARKTMVVRFVQRERRMTAYRGDAHQDRSRRNESCRVLLRYPDVMRVIPLLRQQHAGQALPPAEWTYRTC